MSVVQYVTYLVAGFILFFVMALYMGVAAGVSVLGAAMFFAPMFLFGFVSGLSFSFPRMAAILAIFLVSPFLYVGGFEVVYPSPASEPMFILLPSLIIAVVSGLVIWVSNKSVWSKVSSTGGRTVVLIAALAPALYTMWVLVRFFSRVTFVRNS